MARRLRHIAPLITLAAALSIWASPVAAADFKPSGSCQEVSDTGECVSPPHSSDAPPEIQFTPRQPYLDTLRTA
jgi:hypothetical protein